MTTSHPKLEGRNRLATSLSKRTRDSKPDAIQLDCARWEGTKLDNEGCTSCVLTQSAARSADANLQPQYIRLSQLLALLPVSASSVWRWVRCGRLKAIKLGPRITVFSRDEVMDVFFSEAAR